MHIKEPIGVIFDFDGTLSDSLPGAHRGVSNVCHRSGVRAPTYVEFLRTFKAPYEPCYRSLGVSVSRENIWRWYEEAAGHDGAEMFPDVHETLEHLTRHKAVVGIVTTRRLEPVRVACTKAGIDHHLSYLVGGAENKADALVNFCREKSVLPSRTWFVGDFPSDMRDGRLAGVRCLGITRGNPVADLLIQAGAEECIEHLDELPRIIRCNGEASR